MADHIYSWDDPDEALDSSEKPLAVTLHSDWVKTELIPLLEMAYGQQEAGYWEERVQEAVEKVDSLVRVVASDLEGFADSALRLSGRLLIPQLSVSAYCLSTRRFCHVPRWRTLDGCATRSTRVLQYSCDMRSSKAPTRCTH
jgi:hypothetical protein